MILGIIANLLLTSCASFSFGKPCNCETITLPPKPIVESCIASDRGTVFCCNSVGCLEFPAVNKVCRDAAQDSSVWNWIDNAIREAGQ